MTASTICGSFQTDGIEKRWWLPPALPSERKGCQAAKEPGGCKLGQTALGSDDKKDARPSVRGATLPLSSNP